MVRILLLDDSEQLPQLELSARQLESLREAGVAWKCPQAADCDQRHQADSWHFRREDQTAVRKLLDSFPGPRR